MSRVENQIGLSGQKMSKAPKVLMVTLAVLLVLGAMSVCPVYADNTGWKNPSANTADTGGNGDGFEVSPENAYSDGGGVASNMAGVGDRHRYYGYDFGLPGGATITGIEVRLDWYLDIEQGNSKMYVELSWDGGANWTSAKKTKNGGTSETTDTLGGPSDTWGHSWTADELSSANFRVRITCTLNSPHKRDYHLDWVPVNVYDDPPTAVDLASFTARSGLSAAASRDTWHFWPWVGLIGLAMLVKSQIRRVEGKILHEAQIRQSKGEDQKHDF